MTYLETVNSVLRRLRESEVTNVSDTPYSNLIGEFVNDAKREVEDSWYWSTLYTSVQLNTANLTETASFSIFRRDGSRASLTKVLNDTSNIALGRISPDYWMRLRYLTDDFLTATGLPSEFYYVYDPSLDKISLTLNPVPDGTYSLVVNLFIPQIDLTTDLQAVNILTPTTPIIWKAYALALSERGEDGGNSFGEALMAYQSFLGDSIILDKQTFHKEDIWRVD